MANKGNLGGPNGETQFDRAFKRDNACLVRAVVEGGGAPIWGNRISPESMQFWQNIGVLRDAKFQGARNEIMDEFINRINEVILQVNDFNNPLDIFKGGMMEMGDTLQETATDIAQEEKFVGGEPDQFKKTPSKAYSAYHSINRQSQYPITIEDPRLRQAFLTKYGLYDLLGEQVSSLEKGNIVDEFIYSKKLISDTFSLPDLQESQRIKIGDVNSDSPAENIRKWLIGIKSVLRLMTFPSRKYNMKGLMTQSSPQDLVVVLRYDIPLINEVSNLSQAFNPEYMNVNIPIISVDGFGTEKEPGNSDIVGVILDRRALMIRENYRSTTLADNGKGLYRNYWFNIWQLYAASPFKPIVFLTK